MDADPHDEQMPTPPEQDDVFEPGDMPSHSAQDDSLIEPPPGGHSEHSQEPVERAQEQHEHATEHAEQTPVFGGGPYDDDVPTQAWDDAPELAPSVAQMPVAMEPSTTAAEPGESGTALSSDAELASANLGEWQAASDVGEEPASSAPILPLPASDGEWLDIICPYLLSEDGTWRSTQPDPAHRCTAQDPPGTLPSAFQERFCLTDRHDRCEMYKYAQTARTAALEQGGIAAGQVEGARFKPSVRSVPLALGPSASGTLHRGTGRAAPPRHLLVVAGIVGAVIIVVLIVLAIAGSGGSGGGVAASPSSSPSLVVQPTPEPTRAPVPTPTAVPAASLAAGATPGAAPAAVTLLVRYSVQEDEALAKIAAKFGTTRQAILRANEGMADKTPFVTVGDDIMVPVSADMTEADVRAVPGFVEFLEAS